MRIFVLGCLTLLLTSSLMAQKLPDKISIGAAYWGHAIIQPGAKVSVTIPLKKWGFQKEIKGVERTKNLQLFVQPQVGFFDQPNYTTGLLGNAEFGAKFKREDFKFYSAVSVGLGYLGLFNVTSVTVNLQGEIIGETRQLIHNFMPTINYEVGHEITSFLGWYAKLSLGGRFSAQLEEAMVFFGELGVKASF